LGRPVVFVGRMEGEGRGYERVGWTPAGLEGAGAPGLGPWGDAGALGDPLGAIGRRRRSPGSFAGMGGIRSFRTRGAGHGRGPKGVCGGVEVQGGHAEPLGTGWTFKGCRKGYSGLSVLLMGEPWRAIVGAAWASLLSQLMAEPEYPRRAGV